MQLLINLTAIQTKVTESEFRLLSQKDMNTGRWFVFLPSENRLFECETVADAISVIEEGITHDAR